MLQYLFSIGVNEMDCLIEYDDDGYLTYSIIKDNKKIKLFRIVNHRNRSEIEYYEGSQIENIDSGI